MCSARLSELQGALSDEKQAASALAARDQAEARALQLTKDKAALEGQVQLLNSQLTDKVSCSQQQTQI